MENRIFEHIEFLLPKHNCVIVPDLGGFIVNVEPATRRNDGSIGAPKYSIVFNKDLKYNDGLLASSIQSVKNISYSNACNIIAESVKHIKQTLLQDKPLLCGKIGVLQLDGDNNITFTGNTMLVHPQLYGLGTMHLSFIDALENNNTRKEKYTKVKYKVASMAAVAAALFLFVMPAGKIGNSDHSTIQQAGFINSVKRSFIPPVETINVNNEISGNTEAINEEETVLSKPARTYYIIVGGEESEKRAQRLLEKFQSQGLENAAIVKSPTLYRIYIASYSDKSEAERFLDIFRLENPKYATAWLYSQRNK